MPPKVERKSVINIKPEELILQCEWRECTEMFKSVDRFTQHVSMHLMQHLHNTSQHESGTGKAMQCLWHDCNVEIDGEASDYLRHVYFHAFHVKIKCIGALLLERTGRLSCLFDSRNRNSIPDLPVCLQCGWDQCQVKFENAELFYRHVQHHLVGYPDGNSVEGGCKCLWQGCNVVVKSRHKLKDHCKSHTQEKLVACPTCGALFSCRTKFFDHLSRQQGNNSGKQYQCSHCNSTFASERLLRDHMRYHVNQYKCPFCDMTSPSPSNMRLHIKYRHSQDKPFKCDICTYRCKSMADLKKHSETHNTEGPYKCEFLDCQYKAKHYKRLEGHYSRMHQKQSATYQCHVCIETFTRGALLTTHLKTKHNFNWPAGHSRFRYKRHADGKFRLQTVRYESVVLTRQEETSLNVSSTSEQVSDPPDSNNSYPTHRTKGIVLVEKQDRTALLDMNTSNRDVCLLSLFNSEGQKKTQQCSENQNTNDKHRKEKVDDIEKDNMDIESLGSNISVVQDVQDTDFNINNSCDYNKPGHVHSENNATVEEPIEIRIITNEAGEYMVQNDNNGLKETVSRDIQKQMEIEGETMYNLQMLGDVALQDKRQESKVILTDLI
ncbi:histone H4 transcription factor-like [Ruditapes philippinarum]|uniref:histone H4 transcription factor-like n=1 Tax=Ruditapes philippinarum TaxID=129788 RepID=UPI00295B8B57|nr:histone H4 transcription factor-like [Ruditapes philippinarum]